MQKKLTILFAFAIFVLVLGMQTDSYACHKNANPHGKNSTCDDGGGGGGVDIPLCVTLPADSNIQRIGGNGSLETFCDGEVHVQARIDRTAGVLAVTLLSLATPRIRLDFSDCVDNDPNCGARADEFAEIVTGEPPGDTLPRLAMVGFNSDDTLDFTTLPSSSPANLVVRFGFFNENFQQIRRRINYGPIVNGLNVGGVLEGCTSNPVTVTRFSDGCWVVESIAPDLPTEEGDEACLFKGTGRGKRASIELQGTYHMPFQMFLKDQREGIDTTGCPS